MKGRRRLSSEASKQQTAFELGFKISHILNLIACIVSFVFMAQMIIIPFELKYRAFISKLPRKAVEFVCG